MMLQVIRLLQVVRFEGFFFIVEKYEATGRTCRQGHVLLVASWPHPYRVSCSSSSGWYCHEGLGLKKLQDLVKLYSVGGIAERLASPLFSWEQVILITTYCQWKEGCYISSACLGSSRCICPLSRVYSVSKELWGVSEKIAENGAWACQVQRSSHENWSWT